MLTPEQISALRDAAGEITDPINDYLLEEIARRVSEAGQITGAAAYQAWRARTLGKSQREIKKELKKLLKEARREMNKLLTQAAKAGYDADVERLTQGRAIPFAQNRAIREIVTEAVKQAEDDFTNITQTLGMVGPYGNALPLQDAYRAAVDYAVQQVTTGAADYVTAVRRATKNLAEKGIRTIDYESGVHTSLEAAVRRSVMGGLGLMQERINEANHDSFGCDGWEVSAHANSAPDHEPVQGRQYSDAEYAALNSVLVRRIGTLNCGHVAFPIILGVNEPQYTPEQLEQLREENEKGVTIGGKHYTGYEAAQRQRRLERAIRRQKRRVLVDEAAGDEEKRLADQIKLRRYQQEYSRFSKAAGLRTEDERTQVAGFGSEEAARASGAAEQYYQKWSKEIGVNPTVKTLAKYYDVKYDNSPRYELLKQYAKDVQTGWISPLAGFDGYEQLHGRIESEIVGRAAANGVLITGQNVHFMQRVIGTMVDPEKLKKELKIIRRSGVEIDDIKDALFSPVFIGERTVKENGKPSIRFSGSKCHVSINPDTGELIQTNPRRR